MVEMCSYQLVYKCVNAGQRYITNISPQHLNVLYSLADILSMNASRLHEADAVSFRCFAHVPFVALVFFDIVPVSYTHLTLPTKRIV